MNRKRRGVEMEENRNMKSVFQVTGRIVSGLSKTLDTSEGKATLANLRNSIGKPLSETVDIWPLVFSNLPDEFLSASGHVTHEEEAILTALQLYAVHQQGSRVSVSLLEKTDEWENMGKSLSYLRSQDSTAIDRRFNTMITATDFEELIHHLRQMIKLLKAKEQGKVNYARLAEDLYWFSRGYPESVRIRWTQSYYRTQKPKDKGDIENA
jgi:CRISPR system Cascade subunit CasB